MGIDMCLYKIPICMYMMKGCILMAVLIIKGRSSIEMYP